MLLINLCSLRLQPKDDVKEVQKNEMTDYWHFRNDCFTSDYFKGCLEALQMTDEIEQIQVWIKQLHGAEPGV